MKTAYFIILLFFLVACGQSPKTENNNDSKTVATSPQKEVSPALAEKQADTISQKPAANPYANVSVEVKTYQNDTDKTWGYDLYIDQKLYIHQPSIPSVPGNSGFSTVCCL